MRAFLSWFERSSIAVVAAFAALMLATFEGFRSGLGVTDTQAIVTLVAYMALSIPLSRVRRCRTLITSLYDASNRLLDRSPKTFTEVLEILGYLLPSKLRREVYEPSFLEIEVDLRTARNRCRKRWKRIAIAVIFVMRGALLFTDVIRVGVVRRLRPLVPQRLAEWWTRSSA